MPTSAIRTKANGLEPLAMSMVLPHERKAVRLPVVPATLTALLETMANSTVPVPDGQSRRAFLCRDASYPLWMERTFVNACSYLQSQGSATSWVIPTAANKAILLPVWEIQNSYANPLIVPPNSTVDGTSVSLGRVTDYTPVALVDDYVAIYIPPFSDFVVRVATSAAGGGDGLEAEFGYIVGGEVKYCTVLIRSAVDGFLHIGAAGEPIPANSGEGNYPVGFTWLKALRTGSSAVNGAVTPVIQLGWSTDGRFDALGNTPKTLFMPFFNPPEFANSTLPYSKTRLNASAALFTNVTAALSKEGTVLAARLKPSVVDPWSFSTTNIDSVHPKLRYYGPLEKGLYTFTTPSGNVDTLDDCRLALASNSTMSLTQRPLFNAKEIGVYNAIVFQDLGSAASGTQLATSCYTHLEFESTSSLFPIGVSTMTLESLHAAEVALLSFGHFHENPPHWSAIASAAAAILRTVAPMVAPVVAHYGQKVLDRGVAMLQGKSGGERSMPQASLQEKPKRVPARPKAKASKQQRKKK